MNREDIITLARDAGFEIDCCSLEWHGRIERFAALVAAAAKAEEREAGQKWFDAITTQHKQEILAEREACAKVADDHERHRCEAWIKVLATGGEVPSASLPAVAAAIRARRNA